MRHPEHLHWSGLLALATALTALPACGGGGASDPDPTPTPTSQTLTLGSEAARDGWCTNHDEVGVDVASGLGGTGDVGEFGSVRQFFSFDLSSLPAGATVESATVRIYQAFVLGSPYETHGDVIVDHLAYDLLDGSDYDAAPLTADIGTLSTTETLEYKTLNVTAQVLADIAATRTRTQFRTRWSITNDDGDPETDSASFVEAEDTSLTGAPPQLVITYTLP